MKKISFISIVIICALFFWIIQSLKDTQDIPLEIHENKHTIMHFIGEDNEDDFFFSHVTSVGTYQNGLKHGEWVYYKKDGDIDKIEKYNQGQLINSN